MPNLRAKERESTIIQEQPRIPIGSCKFVLVRASVAAAGCAFWSQTGEVQRFAVVFLGKAVVEHKALRHFEGLLPACCSCGDGCRRAFWIVIQPKCRALLLKCSLRYIPFMRKRVRSESIRYSVRLSRPQAERLKTLRDQLHAKSDNEVFDYLVTVGTNQRDDLEQLVYSLFGNLADSLGRRFQSLETVTQLHLALTDTFIKYALTALPEVPASLIATARARATRMYEQVNLTAAREFQRRRDSDAYGARELGIEEEPAYSNPAGKEA
jgi:hypothetical protein